MTLHQVSKLFLELVKDADIEVLPKNEIYFPLNYEDVEKLYETLLEPSYSILTLGDIFIGFESSRKNLFRIGISVRSTNALMRVGVTNLQGLSAYTLRDINDFRNLGANSLYEIMISFLRNLTIEAEFDEQQSIGVAESSAHFLPRQHFDNELHVTGIPEAAISFLSEISTDLGAKDIHVINTRSEISQKISHREVAEDWGVTRQRIHQIENRLRARFRSDKNLVTLCDEIVPRGTYIGVSELLEVHPWLNLGTAIHPIGVSIFNILVFSKLVLIHDEWLVQNAESPISDLLTKIHESDTSEIEQIIGELRVSEQAKIYLESKIKTKEFSSESLMLRDDSHADGLTVGLSAADLWLREFHKR